MQSIFYNGHEHQRSPWRIRNLHNVLCLFLLLSSSLAFAQTESDTSTTVVKKGKADQAWNLDVLVGADKAGADMAARFGNSYKIGFGLKFKSTYNWIFGVKAEFFFGKKINEPNYLSNVVTEQGAVISQGGDLMNVGIFERGYMLGAQVGKVVPILQLNRNSGPVMIASVGFIQHKIKLFDRDESFPQLSGQYKKGYDRLTNGIYLEDFIGYQYFAKNKLINFYVGLNLVYGMTAGRRTYQFDIQRADTQARRDVLTGVKLGWVLPIYKKITEEIYY
jgi:hypothetical protein